jgi:hypothetical protein
MSSGEPPKILKPGQAIFLACERFLSYCGKPFSAEIEIPSCKAINVYENLEQPTRLKDAA